MHFSAHPCSLQAAHWLISVLGEFSWPHLQEEEAFQPTSGRRRTKTKSSHETYEVGKAALQII